MLIPRVKPDKIRYRILSVFLNLQINRIHNEENNAGQIPSFPSLAATIIMGVVAKTMAPISASLSEKNMRKTIHKITKLDKVTKTLTYLKTIRDVPNNLNAIALV